MPLYQLSGIAPVLPDPEQYWIAPDAVLIGNVILQPMSSIWFKAVLRGDNEAITVGEGSNVQDAAVLHTDMGCPLTIGRDCTIGHGAMLHGCTIGDNSLIGIGAIILNRAVIGKNCLIGAHALVTEDKIIPDNALVMGAPARIIKTLDEQAIMSLTNSANSYVRNWQKYRAELLELT